MILLQALRNAAGRLAASLEDSKLFQHSGERGQFREHVIGQFLRPMLPECYGIGSGQVFSEDGTESREIDIVLYDRVFSGVLFRDTPSSLFPCESVYGSIEVKSNLTTAKLESSIENVRSVKRLKRAPSDMCDLLPFRRLGIGNGLQFDPRTRNPYLGFIFAYEGVAAERARGVLGRHLETGNLPPAHLPDFVFCHKPSYVLLKSKRNHTHAVPVAPGQEFDCYSIVLAGDDTLPLFFLTLNTCLNQIFLKVPDFNKYWAHVVQEAAQRTH